MTLDLTFLAVGLAAVSVCTVVIRLWRLHGGHDNLPGDVMWGGVSSLALYGGIAQKAYQQDVAIACALAATILWGLAALWVRRKSRSRSSLSRYYSN